MLTIMGRTSAGKSSLVRCINRLIPSLMRGKFEGDVAVFGKDISKKKVPELAKEVGMVFQDFESQLFSTNALTEVAFGAENLGVEREELKRRAGWALEVVGLKGFERRDPMTLSGGEKQRLAIASVLAMKPRLFVLDEPTTDLDPIGKQEVLKILLNLKELGSSLMVVEHESFAAAMSDEMAIIKDGKVAHIGAPLELLSDIKTLEENGIRPPDAAIVAGGLSLGKGIITPQKAIDAIKAKGLKPDKAAFEKLLEKDVARCESYGGEIISVQGLSHTYPDGNNALNDVSLSIKSGEFVAILGQNGSGKTTLAKHLNKLLKPTSGHVKFKGESIAREKVSSMGKRVGYVFQNPDHQIFSATLWEEIAFGPQNFGVSGDELDERVRDAFASVGLDMELKDADPFRLTKGERQRTAIAGIIAMRPPVIILDEPTTGLDGSEQKRIMELLAEINRDGHTIIAITHSVWAAAEYAHRIVLMREGGIIADSNPRDMMQNSEALEAAMVIAPDATVIGSAFGMKILSAGEIIEVLK